MKPVRNDSDLVGVIDELKHQIKEGAQKAPMCFAFNEMLNKFIAQWRLGEDQHSFAAWPNRIAMRCTHCERVEEMDRVVGGGLPKYRCSCGCQHEFKGTYEEFEDDEGWGGPFGH